MNFTPTIFLTQLLAAMQVLMTLDMPLSTTMALPVTSKPIESTVENLAWQAWIELPPEIKQQVKSRKVTPKSIFTLPNRIDCPEGHKQVDTKCIPIVIGTNADLIALNYLSLIAGNSPTDEQYDYDDVMEEELSPLNFGAQMQIGEADKSAEGITQELRPPTKDEPLKFNIFENKFNIYHEEPLEDYSSISNESGGGSGGGSTISDKEIGNKTPNENLNTTELNVTAINDLVKNSFNNSEVKTAPILDTLQAESNALTTLADTTADFKIDAISLPASGLDKQLPHKLSIFQTDSSIQLVTTVMDEETEKHSENDIQTLLQTESLLPLINQATATTLLNTALEESSSLTTVPLEESSSDSEFTLNVGESEEMTTIPNIMEQVMETKDKIEYTRSVTMNPLISDENDSNDDEGKDTTLETIMNDEPLDTTTATTIQLEDTTIIENFETTTTPLSFEHSSVADSIDLKELLLRQEQAFKDFEELQRMRKGQSEQHTVLKKSKVEPVEVLSATTTTTTTTSTTAMPATLMDELITAETVTPLLTVHNENDNNNDRFYYQHFAKQDLELASDNQRTNSELTPATIKTQEIAAATTTLSEIEATMPTTITSEIDLAEELRLINELVKGIRPAAATTTTTTTTKIPVTTSSTTTPSTTIETISSLNDDIKPSSTYIPPTRESLNSTIKPTLSTSQIWSKIMPLLTTPKEIESSTIQSTLPESSVASSTNDIKTTSELSLITNRSHRNSKIIRINGFNTINSNKFPNTNWSATTTTTTTTSTSSTTTTEDPLISSTTPNTNSEDLSSTSDNSYESYWWLPVAWRLDKKPQPEQEINKEEDQPLLLRFWSAYHAPKSS